jgi:hypothetical protein
VRCSRSLVRRRACSINARNVVVKSRGWFMILPLQPALASQLWSCIVANLARLSGLVAEIGYGSRDDRAWTCSHDVSAFWEEILPRNVHPSVLR